MLLLVLVLLAMHLKSVRIWECSLEGRCLQRPGAGKRLPSREFEDENENDLLTPYTTMLTIAHPNESGDVLVKAGDTSARGRIHRNKSAITHKMTGTSVIDHDAFKLQVTETSAPL